MNVQNNLRVGVVLSLITALIAIPSAYAAPQDASSTQAAPARTAQDPQSPQPQSGTAPEQPPADQATPNAPASDQLPDSPGTVQAQSNASQPSVPPQDRPQPDQPQQATHEAVGTAAAPAVPTMGIAASRPAGAAAAPAKQRQVRSLLIKVGAIVGVGAALATTMALTQASPGRPPGSH